MDTTDLISAISAEAKRVSEETGRDAIVIAIELTKAEWKPPCVATREARRLVADLFEHQKRDERTARVIRQGLGDDRSEVKMAKAMFVRALQISSDWIDRAEPGKRLGERLLAFGISSPG